MIKVIPKFFIAMVCFLLISDVMADYSSAIDSDAQEFATKLSQLVQQEYIDKTDPYAFRRANIFLAIPDKKSLAGCAFNKVKRNAILKALKQKGFTRADFMDKDSIVNAESREKAYAYGRKRILMNSNQVENELMFTLWFSEPNLWSDQYRNPDKVSFTTQLFYDMADNTPDAIVNFDVDRALFSADCIDDGEMNSQNFRKSIASADEPPMVTSYKFDQGSEHIEAVKMPMREFVNPNKKELLQAELFFLKVENWKGRDRKRQCDDMLSQATEYQTVLELKEKERYCLYIDVSKPAYAYFVGRTNIKDYWATYLVPPANVVKNLRYSSDDPFVLHFPKAGVYSLGRYKVSCKTKVPCGDESLSATISETYLKSPRYKEKDEGYFIIDHSKSLNDSIWKTRGTEADNDEDEETAYVRQVESIKRTVFLKTRKY